MPAIETRCKGLKNKNHRDRAEREGAIMVPQRDRFRAVFFDLSARAPADFQSWLWANASEIESVLPGPTSSSSKIDLVDRFAVGLTRPLTASIAVTIARMCIRGDQTFEICEPLELFRRTAQHGVGSTHFSECISAKVYDLEFKWVARPVETMWFPLKNYPPQCDLRGTRLNSPCQVVI